MQQGSSVTYEVRYNFEAESDGELTVFARDFVESIGERKGDWILVRKRDSPSQKGFVPFSFLEEYRPPSPTSAGRGSDFSSREPLRSAPRPPTGTAGMSGSASSRLQQAGAVFPSPTTSAGASGAAFGPPSAATPSSSSGSALLRSSLYAPNPVASTAPTSRVALVPPPPPVAASSGSTGASDTFTEMLGDFRSRLTRIMEEREDAFRKLERSISATAKEIQAAQERNAGLSQKIVELDNWIESEKQKWKEQWDQEKRAQRMRQMRAQS